MARVSANVLETVRTGRPGSHKVLDAVDCACDLGLEAEVDRILDDRETLRFELFLKLATAKLEKRRKERFYPFHPEGRNRKRGPLGKRGWTGPTWLEPGKSSYEDKARKAGTKGADQDDA